MQWSPQFDEILETHDTEDRRGAQLLFKLTFLHFSGNVKSKIRKVMCRKERFPSLIIR